MTQTATHPTTDNVKKIDQLTRTRKDLTAEEVLTNLFLFSPDVRMIETKFRSIDRNLTFRIRNHASQQLRKKI